MANSTAVAKTTQEKNITDEVLGRVKSLEQSGDLQLPPNYSAANALKSAWLILNETKDRNGKLVLEGACSQTSIANALLNMVIQGLNPVKKQCYFVAYGNALTLMRSYLGTIAVTKRLKGITNVFANCIYEGDVFEYKINLQTGLKEITKHDQKFENIDITKIKGAYAVITRKDKPPYVEIMNINQIRKAWEQGASGGKSKAHNNFTDEMAKKTVINRACKIFVNTTDDSDILVNAINNSTEIDPENTVTTDYEVEEEVKENANQKVIDIQPEEQKAESVKPEQPKQEPVKSNTSKVEKPVTQPNANQKAEQPKPQQMKLDNSVNEKKYGF